ncbi:hypothetical protein IVB38_24875 [Bradyrhizobium sp. 38]|uniref:hypothetical protein n=1 Tax=unclassified Bradyrhizobium TaxID=2631580 RepID=UPI001FF76ADC|nr:MULTISPECIES: hypothetical protein [unclassified Bradyrhizobium]MCK1339153.1 hypothetical protein [Bradyrhizobium sp. 38]MCK1775943.1 hypothetical protein [Bradyrhizobium sp. 132]
MRLIYFERKCWINLRVTGPNGATHSTHDYALDFDEDEGLMAIVSVTVFAIVLCDQIDGKLPFDTAADPRAPAATPTTRQAHRCLT